MKGLNLGRYALSSCVATALLAGCGASQPPIGASAVFENGAEDRITMQRSKPSRLALLEADPGAPDSYKVSGPLLFVTNTNGNSFRGGVAIYDAKARNGRPIATITKSVNQLAGDCVDRDGTLYVASEFDGISEYALGTTKPFKKITKGISNPAFCTIDGHGNLWVTNMARVPNVSEYLKGASKPRIRITKGLVDPDGVAIDHADNLYVVNLVPYGSSNIQVYPRGSRSPSRTITDGVTWPVGIAVDANGTLYVTNDVQCNIEEYLTGQSQPYQTITTDIDGPTDVSFARNGRMYVVNEGEQNCVSNGPWPVILEFPPGSVSPSKREITRGLLNPIGIAYYPPLLP
jgi:sugar lactone lactonase YvrE